MRESPTAFGTGKRARHPLAITAASAIMDLIIYSFTNINHAQPTTNKVPGTAPSVRETKKHTAARLAKNFLFREGPEHKFRERNGERCHQADRSLGSLRREPRRRETGMRDAGRMFRTCSKPRRIPSARGLTDTVFWARGQEGGSVLCSQLPGLRSSLSPELAAEKRTAKWKSQERGTRK